MSNSNEPQLERKLYTLLPFNGEENGRILLLFLLVGMAHAGFSQLATPPNYFAGNWEISVVGSPLGDVKFTTDLVRKAGKLTVALINTTDPSQATPPLMRVEEKGDKLMMSFDSSQGGEVPMELTKVNDDNLTGTISQKAPIYRTFRFSLAK